MAPVQKTIDTMKTIPATITTHAATTYSVGGFHGSCWGGGGAGDGSGASVMPFILPHEGGPTLT
jgi:hypothetical protein